jgi:ectoine hydroxylase-related dioxygenase (phytanoyl-CoA dioxygenase family)
MTDGYALLPGWLEPDELPAIRAAADAVVDGDAAPACPRPNNTLLPLRWNDDLVALLVADERRVASLATATGAADLRWISGYLSVKEPRTGALDWHQDWWCWDHPVSFEPAAAQVALLVYLGDTDERTGALRVYPGSHRGEPGDPVTLRARAGDAVALDYRLLHGTHPNAAESRRDAVLLSFTPSWAELPADIRGHLIAHLAQPTAGEPTDGSPVVPLLPRFDGPRRDLPLNRTPPSRRVAA